MVHFSYLGFDNNALVVRNASTFPVIQAARFIDQLLLGNPAGLGRVSHHTACARKRKYVAGRLRVEVGQQLLGGALKAAQIFSVPFKVRD